MKHKPSILGSKNIPKTASKVPLINGCKNLTLHDWIVVFAFIDAHPKLSQGDVVKYFGSRPGSALIFTQCTLSIHCPRSGPGPGEPGPDWVLTPQVRSRSSLVLGPDLHTRSRSGRGVDRELGPDLSDLMWQVTTASKNLKLVHLIFVYFNALFTPTPKYYSYRTLRNN